MIDFSKIKVKNPEKLRFGTAGIPLSTPVKNTINGLKHVKALGLEGMELEFVHSVNLNPDTAKAVYREKIDNDLTLTCHGSYYVNLNAVEPAKVGASRSRIIQAANIARLAGAWSLTFHAAFYLKSTEQETYDNVKTQLKKLVEHLREQNNDIWLRPETTGKPTQFGSLKEIVKLSEEIDGVLPCVDFSHLHARHGKNNTFEEFRENLSLIETKLGRKGLDNMHIHVSGIEYGAKGEKHHLFLEDSDMNYKDLLKALKEFKAKGIVISESPNIEQDALLMKKYYEKL